MDKSITNLITALHSLNASSSSKLLFSYFATGCGSTAINYFLNHAGNGGASHSIVEFQIPYCKQSTIDLLNRFQISKFKEEDVKFVSSKTCKGLARAAYLRGLELKPSTTFNSIVGLAVTGAIRSQQIRKGKDHAYIGLYSWDQYIEIYINLNKSSSRTRLEQDELISQKLVELLSTHFIQYSKQHSSALIPLLEDVQKNIILDSNDQIETKQTNILSDKQKLIHQFLHSNSLKDSGYLIQNLDSQSIFYQSLLSSKHIPFPSLINFQRKNDASLHVIYFPGSFNPLHRGHIELAKEARLHIESQYSKSQVIIVFELAVTNADKSPIDEATILERLEQFTTQLKDEKDMYCMVSKNPLFVQKAQQISLNFETLLPKSDLKTIQHYFLLGLDTVIRLVDPKYYENSVEKMKQVLNDFKHVYRFKFIAGPRMDSKTGQLMTMKQVVSQLDSNFHDSFIELCNFRIDISSTELREKSKK